MKKLLIIPFLFISFLLAANTYYVSTTGSDGNVGSLASPWATWQKAFDVAGAGDTVYFRGGVYYSAGTGTHPRIEPYAVIPRGHSGTADDPICYFNYPGEVPILDCTYQGSSSSIISGIALTSVQYLHFKGLTIRNLFQRGTTKLGQGVTFGYSANIIFENMTFHDISGRCVGGAAIVGDYSAAVTPVPILCDTTQFINCDFYNFCDSTSANPGNAADGIKVTLNGRTSADYPTHYWYIQGCRAWNYSDDGFDIGGNGEIVYDNCWVMSTNKYAFAGIEGNGIKSSGLISMLYVADTALTIHWRTYKNCLAVHCAGMGFHNNVEAATPYVSYQNNALYYNNTTYNCESGYFDALNNYIIWANGRTTEFYNNISYASTSATYEVMLYRPSIYLENHNTWDATQQATGWPGWVETDTVTVTDADFVSVDSLTIEALFTATRNADGSLPSFPLQLAEGSDLIDAGTVNVSIDEALTVYNGTAPDIGAFETNYGAEASTATDILSYTFANIVGVAVVNATTHTVTAVLQAGEDVSAITPTFTLSSGATSDPASGVEDDYTNPVTITVTAEDEETEQEWTVTITVDDDPVPTVATVATTSANYNAFKASVTGRIYSANGGTLTARGICWSETNTSPTISDKHTKYTPYVGSYTDVIRGLRGGKTYYVRAYATTEEGGTAYGDAISITTPEHTIVGNYKYRDGKIVVYR